MRNLFRNSIFLFFVFILQGCLAVSASEGFDKFLGTYETYTGYEYSIGKSSVRLYLFNPQTLDYRGLYQLNDSTFIAYESILKNDISKQEIKLTFHKSKNNYNLTVLQNEKEVKAAKSSKYLETEVTFSNKQINLKGNLLMPNTSGKVPAVVLVHGSGEQDRNGYASYIRLIADHLARNGIAVLTYDKRGCGKSSGNWASASFNDLAEDALAGYNYLKKNPQIDTMKIGLGGSSQAGWILAKAVSLEPSTPFIFCISGAGMGISAAKQNIYNNQTELINLGANKATVTRAKQAWNALYRYIKNGEQKDGEQLDEFVNRIDKEEYLNYFPPLSNTFSVDGKDYWFQTLEVNYDPIPDWKAYKGDVYTVFGGLDASTPVSLVIDRLQPIMPIQQTNSSKKLVIYPKSSHLILQASKKSDSEFGNLKKFAPYFLSGISDWILSVTQTHSNDIYQVKRLEKDWLRAYEKCNVMEMEKILDDKFQITFPNGYKQDKNIILDGLTKTNENCKQLRLYTTRTEATQYENSVILRGIVTTECSEPDSGEKSYFRQRYTDTYLKIGENWKVIASHLSELNTN